MVAEEIEKKKSILINEKIGEFKKGENPDGSIIGTYKDVEYAIFKQQINPLANGNVDLIFEGDFTKGLVLKKEKPSLFTFDSTDSKTEKLVNKYGTQIMGLNQETFNAFQKKEIKDNFIKRMRDYAKI